MKQLSPNVRFFSREAVYLFVRLLLSGFIRSFGNLAIGASSKLGFLSNHRVSILYRSKN